MKKNKILFIIPSLANGGAERVMLNILNHISRDRFTPHLLLLKNVDHTYIGDLSSDVKVTRMNFNRRIVFNLLLIVRQIKKNKPDAVFVGMGGVAVLLSVFIPFFPGVKWISRETNTVSRKVTSSFMKFLYRNFYQKYDHVIAQCDDMKDDLVASFDFPEHKISVINNPLDTKSIDKKLEDSSSVKLPLKKYNLVACGRLTYQKGFDLLLKAFARVQNKDEFHLTILGSDSNDSGYNKASLMSIVEENSIKGNVTFAGFQQNGYPLLKNADAFILSSRFEGFPNVLLEALYCGTPALANNCPGGIASIINEGQNGYIFEYEKQDFEQKLMAVCGTSFNSELISEDIHKRFNVSYIIRKYEYAIQNCLSV